MPPGSSPRPALDGRGLRLLAGGGDLQLAREFPGAGADPPRLRRRPEGAGEIPLPATRGFFAAPGEGGGRARDGRRRGPRHGGRSLAAVAGGGGAALAKSLRPAAGVGQGAGTPGACPRARSPARGGRRAEGGRPAGGLMVPGRRPIPARGPSATRRPVYPPARAMTGSLRVETGCLARKARFPRSASSRPDGALPADGQAGRAELRRLPAARRLRPSRAPGGGRASSALIPDATARRPDACKPSKPLRCEGLPQRIGPIRPLASGSEGLRQPRFQFG